jgi:hypothetical protein
MPYLHWSYSHNISSPYSVVEESFEGRIFIPFHCQYSYSCSRTRVYRPSKNSTVSLNKPIERERNGTYRIEESYHIISNTFCGIDKRQTGLHSSSCSTSSHGFRIAGAVSTVAMVEGDIRSHSLFLRLLSKQKSIENPDIDPLGVGVELFC